MTKALALLPLFAVNFLAGAPDLVLVGGTIYTGNDRRPRTEAVVAVGGRIAYVGSEAEARRQAPTGAPVIDLGGRWVFPGFTDAHAHLAGIGFRELNFNLEVGKCADFTVLSADIMSIPEAEILKTRCIMTVVGGQVVYAGPPFPPVVLSSP